MQKCKNYKILTSLGLLAGQQAVQLTKKGVHLHDYLKFKSLISFESKFRSNDNQISLKSTWHGNLSTTSWPRSQSGKMYNKKIIFRQIIFQFLWIYVGRISQCLIDLERERQHCHFAVWANRPRKRNAKSAKSCKTSLGSKSSFIFNLFFAMKFQKWLKKFGW